MVPKENGGVEEECLTNWNKEDKYGKRVEGEYESARHSASSQGETRIAEVIRVKRASRVPQKLSRKQSIDNLTRPRSTNEKQESTKLQFKSSNTNRKKLERNNKCGGRTKNTSDQKPEIVKTSTRSSSESSEGTDEKVVEDKTVEEFKEIDLMDGALNCDQSVGTDNETFDTEDNSLDDDRMNPYRKMEEMELRIEKLEEELREVAALEISLYSVVPEHGSSAHKVHTAARRLSRLYIHACKHWTNDKQASVAKSTVSGLVRIGKSCGSDVPRLTFWLSNVIVLRELITAAFRNTSHSSSTKKFGEMNHIANKNESKFPSMKWKSRSGSEVTSKSGIAQFIDDDWRETNKYTASLEKIEAWIFSRIVESVWWQTFTPYMQSPADNFQKTNIHGKLSGPALGDQQQGNFSIKLWKRSFLDAFSRLCPLRAGGHECGCLPILARLVMEQCVSRLDVAMFNAILRESASEIPTDPVSDPIVDPKVLPMPAGDLSFGSGAQLKNVIGNWSRWLTDLFGMDDDNSVKDDQTNNIDDETQGGEAGSKCFCLLNSLCDLLMLPKDMLLDKSTREQVCQLIGSPLIMRILCNFSPDEFCPDPVPGAVLEELNSESLSECHLSAGEAATGFPYAASPVVYNIPSAADVARKVSDIGDRAGLGRNASMVRRKGYTSDDDLDDLDSALTSIIDKAPLRSPAVGNGNGNFNGNLHANVRFELLREVWSV